MKTVMSYPYPTNIINMLFKWNRKLFASKGVSAGFLPEKA